MHASRRPRGGSEPVRTGEGGRGGRNAERLDGTVGETRRWVECAGGRVSGGHVGRTRRRSESYAPSRRDTANGDTGSSLDDQPTKTCSHAAESEKNAPQGRHLDSARGRSGWCRSDQLLALAQVAKHAGAEDGARESSRDACKTEEAGGERVHGRNDISTACHTTNTINHGLAANREEIEGRRRSHWPHIRVPLWQMPANKPSAFSSRAFFGASALLRRLPTGTSTALFSRSSSSLFLSSILVPPPLRPRPPPRRPSPVLSATGAYALALFQSSGTRTRPLTGARNRR